MIERLQCDEIPSIIDYGTIVMCTWNNELEHEYNGNDDIPQHFEVF